MQRQAPVFSGWIALTKFPDFPDCAGVPSQRRTKIHARSSSNGHLLGKPRQSPVGRRSRKIARTTRPPTQMQPQAQTARTQQVLSAIRMSSCSRSVSECRDVDASATDFGPRPLDSGHQGKSDTRNQRADKTSDHEGHEVRR